MRRKKFSFSILFVEALGVVLMLKFFVWILANKVLNKPSFNIPELDYALAVLGALLVIRWGYGLIKKRILQRGQAFKPDERHEPESANIAVCALCGKPVSAKVLNYCRANAERFGGKIYCYDHQVSFK